jgi:hypothetical protein
MTICWNYVLLRDGQLWEQARRELAGDRVTLIEGDRNMIENIREHYFKTTRTIQTEQLYLRQADESLRQAESNAFTEKIIAQKNSLIKAEWMKTNAKLNRIIRQPTIVASR